MKIIEVATAVIFNGEGRCLYALRPADAATRRDMWEHPGGKLELRPDKSIESIKGAAQREALEELDAGIDVFDFIGTAPIDFVDYMVVINAVAARICLRKPRPMVSQALRWMDPQYAVDVEPCSPGTYYLHRALMQWIGRNRSIFGKAPDVSGFTSGWVPA